MKPMKLVFVMMLILVVLCACSRGSAADSAAMIREAGNFVEKNFRTENYNVTILEKDRKLCTAEITAVCEYNTYIETVVAEIDLRWNSPGKRWEFIPGSYREKNREMDFSPLNGTWKATYIHASTYLTQDRIPYTFTFSAKKPVTASGDSCSLGSIDVQHELNKIWTEYLNPGSISSPMHYESGIMQISGKRTGGYNFRMNKYWEFQITFRETNNDSFYETDCILEINADQIIFYDGHGARKCTLVKE